jgi:alpha-beta hydrolase superfamily lysophospholipase
MLKKYVKCVFWPTEEDVQHTSHSRLVLLSAHSWGGHVCFHYLAQHDHRQRVR